MAQSVSHSFTLYRSQSGQANNIRFQAVSAAGTLLGAESAAGAGYTEIGGGSYYWGGNVDDSAVAVRHRLPGSPDTIVVVDLATPDSASIAAVKAKTDLIPSQPAAKADVTAAKTSADAAKASADAAKASADAAARPGDPMTLTAPERTALSNALLDLAGSIDGKTVRQALQLIAAATAGKLSGAATDTIVIMGLDGTTTRIIATVDADGNRTAATYS